MADCSSSTDEGEQKETEIKALSDNNMNNHNRVIDGSSSTDLAHAPNSATSSGSVGDVVDVSDVVLVCGSDSGSSIENPVKVSDCNDTLLDNCSGAVAADRNSLPTGGVVIDNHDKHDLLPSNSSVTDDRDKCNSVPIDGHDKLHLLPTDHSDTNGCDLTDSLSPDVETSGSLSGMNTDSVSSSAKDDSGIDITRSPNASNQPRDEKTSAVADAQQTSTGDQSADRGGLGGRPLTSGRRMAADNDDTLAGVIVRNEIEMLMDTDDDDSALHDDSHSQQLDSNADDDDITDNDKSAKSSDGDDDVMEVDLTPPVDTWCPVREIRRREIGYGSQRVPTSHVFVQRSGGSIQLARRLKLQHKLEHHEGCVNCLHFNESGRTVYHSWVKYIFGINF